jgi:hypothetical protein
VDSPQAIGQQSEVRREITVRGDRVGPQCVPAHLGKNNGAQDREGGRVLHECDVGVPMVGGGAGIRVEVEHLWILLRNRQGGVTTCKRSEMRGEGDLFGRANVLIPKEHHPVVEQRLTDGHNVIVP